MVILQRYISMHMDSNPSMSHEEIKTFVSNVLGQVSFQIAWNKALESGKYNKRYSDLVMYLEETYGVTISSSSISKIVINLGLQKLYCRNYIKPRNKNLEETVENLVKRVEELEKVFNSSLRVIVPSKPTTLDKRSSQSLQNG